MDQDRPVYVDIASPTFYWLETLVMILLMNIVMDGDNGSTALRIFILIGCNSLWFIPSKDKTITPSRIYLGAILFDIGLFLLYFWFDYKASFGLVMSQLFYLFLLAVSGRFNRNKK